MPADAIGAPKLLHRLCPHCWNSGMEAVVLCLSRPAKTQPMGTSLPSPANFCHGSVRTALFAMRCDTVGFFWRSHIPSQSLPALVSGAGVFRGWRVPVGFAREISFCPLSPVIVLCLMSRLRMCPRAGFREVTGRGREAWL